ncbi:MAG TPA: AmmeMemoRadiSam system protein B [Candidatus Paceibacterota bacterium]
MTNTSLNNRVRIAWTSYKSVFGVVGALLIVATGWFIWSSSRSGVGVHTSMRPYHVSMYYYDNTDFYPQSVAMFAATKPLEPRPRVFIINQHILAAHLIAQQFAQAADPAVQTVILITQNNWNAGTAPIITSGYDWKTPLGAIAANTAYEQLLVTQGIAFEDESIFTNEHGITGIIPYVAQYFPKARIVPLVIRDGTSDQLVDRLAAELAKLDLAKTAIVGTIDMSHYLPKQIADAHDRMTIETIRSFDYASVPKLDIDTAPTLRAMMKTAEAHGMNVFTTTGHANSADLVSDPDLISTTSYITGYFSAATSTSSAPMVKPTDTPVHLFFGGDMMFDRTVAVHAEQTGTDSLFKGLERIFLGNHANIANLEGTITTKPSVAQVDHTILHFTFEPKFADVLSKNHFTVVSQANNHALDFGSAGFVSTQNYLSARGIRFFGSPYNDINLTTPVQINDRTICFVGYHDLYKPDETSAVAAIRSVRPGCGLVIVFPHWGVEYKTTENNRQRQLAHEFIDAGADIVIGAHPHVVEPIEIYKNKAIFYSLGNFIFDQGLSFWTEHGLTIGVEWSQKQTTFTLVPTELNKTEASIAPAAARDKILDVLVSGAGVSDLTRSDILTKKSFTLWNP